MNTDDNDIISTVSMNAESDDLIQSVMQAELSRQKIQHEKRSTLTQSNNADNTTS